jgi:hypothetical protein
MALLKIKTTSKRIVAGISLVTMIMTQSLFGIVNLVPVANAIGGCTLTDVGPASGASIR